MLLSAVSVLVVAQSSSEILEGLMNNPVFGMYKRNKLENVVSAEQFAWFLSLFSLIISKTERLMTKKKVGYKICMLKTFRSPIII